MEITALKVLFKRKWRNTKTYLRKNPTKTVLGIFLLLVSICLLIDNESKKVIVSSRQAAGVDFASKSQGGKVIKITNAKPKVVMTTYIFGIPIWHLYSDPNKMINNESEGRPFTFEGRSGTITLQMGKKMQVNSIQIVHLGKYISEGQISSAPKNIEVHGSDDGINYKTLTRFTYDIHRKEHAQTFVVDAFLMRVNYLKIIVLNNWGHPSETTIFNIKVFSECNKYK
jgi:hypothetical protein